MFFRMAQSVVLEKGLSQLLLIGREVPRPDLSG